MKKLIASVVLFAALFININAGMAQHVHTGGCIIPQWNSFDEVWIDNWYGNYTPVDFYDEWWVSVDSSGNLSWTHYYSVYDPVNCVTIDDGYDNDSMTIDLVNTDEHQRWGTDPEYRYKRVLKTGTYRAKYAGVTGCYGCYCTLSGSYSSWASTPIGSSTSSGLFSYNPFPFCGTTSPAYFYAPSQCLISGFSLGVRN